MTSYLEMAAINRPASYLLPCHPSVRVEDPLSVCEDYDALEVPKWRMVSKLLAEGSIKDTKGLTDVISTFQHDVEFETLRSVLEGMDSSHFFSAVLPVMCTVALRMPELFPTGELPVLHPGKDKSVSLTREQVACLLAHMFFCTLTPPKWSQHWANFAIWYNSTSPPVRAYLQVLLIHFSQLDSSGSGGTKDSVILHRRVVISPPDWQSSPSDISPSLLTPSYNLEPPPEANAEVDFANKDIGFGVSGSQEEVLLGMSPEMCIVMLLAPTLSENETLLIQGARRVGQYKGVGRNVTFMGPWVEEREWSLRCVIAMDALELDMEDCGHNIRELEPNNLNRELNKAYCGFSPLNGKPFSLIATGHWGCGAFGGHRYAKALIQVMAATEANTKLVFHDIQSEDPNFLMKLMSFLALLEHHHVTVGTLYSALLKAGEQQKPLQDLIDLLTNILGIKKQKSNVLLS